MTHQIHVGFTFRLNTSLKQWNYTVTDISLDGYKLTIKSNTEIPIITTMSMKEALNNLNTVNWWIPVKQEIKYKEEL